MKLSHLPSIRLFLTLTVLLSSLLFAQEFKIKQNPRPTQWDAAGKPVEKEDLVIIDPTIWIFKANPTISTFQGKQKVEYSTHIFLHVWNKGEKTYRFPTKIDSVCHSSNYGLPDVCDFQFDFSPSLKTTVAKDDRPAIPIVWAESTFDVAELRPDEAVLLSYKTLIDAENLVPNKKVIFLLFSKHNGRYSFWEGKLKSQIYTLEAISKIFEAPTK